MDTTEYPKVDDLDDLFGFTAARQRAGEEAANITSVYDEDHFVPHRVFINHVDSFNGRHISSVLIHNTCILQIPTLCFQYLADQYYGSTKQAEIGGEGEEGEEEVVHQKLLSGQKYDVIGTLKTSLHGKSEDVSLLLDENKEDEFAQAVLKCGLVIYDITQDQEEIPKALKTLAGSST